LVRAGAGNHGSARGEGPPGALLPDRPLRPHRYVKERRMYIGGGVLLLIIIIILLVILL
jgi:hypothetical protein